MYPNISADNAASGGDRPRFVGLVDLHVADCASVTDDDELLLFLGQIAAAAMLRSRAYERVKFAKDINELARTLVEKVPGGSERQHSRDYLSGVKKIMAGALSSSSVSILEVDGIGRSIRALEVSSEQAEEIEVGMEAAIWEPMREAAR